MAISGIGYAQIYDYNTRTKKATCQESHGQDTNSLMKELCKYKEEILEKVKKGETEPSFSIGASSFTFKQWDKLMQRVDEAIDDMQARVEQEKEEQEKNNKKKEEDIITMEMLEELLGRSGL